MDSKDPSPFLVVHEKPHALLRPFISHYVFRSIRFSPEQTVQKSMPMRLHSSIDFFIGQPFETIECRSGNGVPFERCTVRGPRTTTLYDIRLKDHFKSFTIRFTPTGLYRLTGIPMRRLTNRAVPAPEIEGLPLPAITRQLMQAEDMAGCIRIVEPYLLFCARRSQIVSSLTDAAVRWLTQQPPQGALTRLADHMHVSLRQLERTSLKEIGVGPKTLYRMLRFDRLIRSQIDTPPVKWSSTAYEYGYYDQMHLIRDFRQFLGITPSTFSPADFAF
jgi:AraC-like DNA-binding protein